MTSERAYLDWNATAPVRPEARDAFLAALERFGNPSSVHAEGRAAKKLLEDSREEVAGFMGCQPWEVIFTSGGFEANNLALGSLAASSGERSFASSRIEHGSILGKLDRLVEEGFAPTWLNVTHEGLIDPAALVGKVGFANFQAMNQETGALQPVAEFGEKCVSLGIPWHCDAVQLWGRMEFKVSSLTCSTASLTGHKVGAPKGTGALFAREGVEIAPLLLSGPQEKTRRPGTENVPGFAALAAALRASARDLDTYPAKAKKLRAQLIGGIKSLYPSAVVHGPKDPALQVPNTLCISLPGLEGALLVPALDLEGAAVSSGSACASGATKPSPVLTAMGVNDEVARGTLRITTGWATTEADIQLFLSALGKVLSRISGKD